MIGDPRAGGGRREEALPLPDLLILTLAIYRSHAVSPPLGLATMEMEDGPMEAGESGSRIEWGRRVEEGRCEVGGSGEQTAMDVGGEISSALCRMSAVRQS
jgi:hypothetical protein